MRFTILHVSDLHRDLSDEVQNAALVDSIAKDIAQWQAGTPGGQCPSVCIVSGDTVYGVRSGCPDSALELGRQYEQACALLCDFADRFVGGSRERLVILPGNHDVDYTEAFAACERVEIPADPLGREQLVAELGTPNSRLRWSWDDFCFYRIVDDARYARRFRPFQTMYAQFYGGTRTFPDAPEEQYSIFDFPDLRLSVVALNSCHNNDPLRRIATIHPEALNAACQAIREPARAGWLKAAAWHHSISGPASEVDYLDNELLQYIIEAGFSLGFFGHQHFPDCIDERYRFGGSGKITTIGCGTLCGGPRALRPGEHRSYNLLEIDTNTMKGRLHKRQMVNQSFALPLWGAGHFVSSGLSYVDFELRPPALERPPELDRQLALEEADRMVGKGQWAGAVALLRSYRNDPLARRYLIRALSGVDDPAATIDLLAPPQSPAEVVLVGDALLQIGTRETMAEFLRSKMVKDSDDASVIEVGRRLERKLMS